MSISTADDKNANYEALKETALSLGAAVFGVADISSDEVRKSAGISGEITGGVLDRAVVFGVALSRKILETVKDRPNQIYYFHYQRTNILIDHIALRLNAKIQKAGYQSFPVAASQITDWEKQRAAADHRELARLAGIGRRGRNNLVVSPLYGAGLRFGTVFTDMPLVCDSPVAVNDCGGCRLCIELCPAGAIKENSFDRDACYQKLKEFMKTERLGQMICGVCVRACPAPALHTRSKK